MDFHGDDALDQFGAWMLASSNDPYLGGDSTVSMEDLLVPHMSSPSPEIDMDRIDLDAIMDESAFTATMSPPAFPPLAVAQVNLSLNPTALPFIPPTVYRPQLQVATSDLALQPVNPAYTVELPRSAPDIRVDGPDSLPVLTSSITLPPRSQSRPRAASAAPNLPVHAFKHSISPLSEEILPQDDFLSPDSALDRPDAPWALVDVANAQHDTAPASGSRPATPSPRGSRSPSRGRATARFRSSSVGSRASSAASSARSSATGEHECPHAPCQKRFHSLAKLNHHARYHTPYGQRPVKCDHPNCNARFLFKRELDRHKKNKTHQEPQYHCTLCDNSFGREDHLDRHMHVHARSRTPSSASLPATPMANGPAPAYAMPPAGLKRHPGYGVQPQINDLSVFPPLPLSLPAANMPVDPFTAFSSAAEWNLTFPANHASAAWSLPLWPPP